jgi:ribosomal protein S27AE
MNKRTKSVAKSEAKKVSENARKCVQCANVFTASRKNQLYCSVSCKIEKNNLVLKEKYHSSSKVEKLDRDVKRLQEELSYLKSLPLVIPVQVKDDTIVFRGRKYVKKRMGLPNPVVRAADGYGVLYLKLGAILRKNPTSTILETYLLES